MILAIAIAAIAVLCPVLFLAFIAYVIAKRDIALDLPGALE